MRKLLLVVILLTGLTVSAQEQFVRHYSQYIYTEKGVAGEWKDTDATMYFNYNGENTRYKIVIGRYVYDLIRVSAVEKGTTIGGYGYQLITVITSDTGERMYLQLFDDYKYGIRLYDDKNNRIELQP